MNVREITCSMERLMLSPYAAFSDSTKGREREQETCDMRTEYQRDRDKIIHSKSFRRLKHKTQVFITPQGDHYRTRLTHTLEVSQIARTISRCLRLNEDLTEAIALGHDLGHTPFGHAGERLLNKVCPYGFKHNEQSLRVADVLENGTGMNLTYEVRNGILCHTGSKMPETLEGKSVCFSDRIAYINHDIDDAIRAGILKEDDLPKECTSFLGHSHGQRIDTMIRDIVNESSGKNDIIMSEECKCAMDRLRAFLFENVYIDSIAKTEESKACGILQALYEYYIENTHKLPREILERGGDSHIMVCDHIAGMTDSFAVYTYNQIFVPKSWQKF